MKYILNWVCILMIVNITPAFADNSSKEENSEQIMKPYDAIFIDELITHHKEGVEMAKLAMEKAERKELKDLATMMLKNQQSEINNLKEWRLKWYSNIPYKNHGVGMNMQKLMGLSGKEFDVAFIDSMIAHHPGAIYLGFEVKVRGKHILLINLGKKIIKMQTKELNQLRSWRNDWYPED